MIADIRRIVKKHELAPGIYARWTIDWVYCVTRVLRQCNHRFEECVEAVTDFADKNLHYLMGLDPETDAGMDDLHMLFGAVCCIAELQRFLPGSVITEKPLKLVLDRRPFI